MLDTDTQIEPTEAKPSQAKQKKQAPDAEAMVDRVAFERALTETGWANSRKDTLPILTCVLIEIGENRLTLTATDLTTSFQTHIPAVCNGSGALAIPEVRVLSWLKSLDAHSLSLSISQQGLQITGLHGETVIVHGMSAPNFPTIHAPGPAVFTVPAASLLTAIQNTVFAISTEESRFTLNGALLEFGDGFLRMAATDGHRLAIQEFPCLIEASGNFLLDRKAMRVLARLLTERPDTEVGVAVGDKFCEFILAHEYEYLQARRLSGKFPEWRRVLKPVPHSFSLEDAAPLTQAIERVSRFTDERSQLIRLTIGHGEVRLLSEISETGSAQESIAIDFEAPKTEFGFNHTYLLDALRQAKAPVQFSFSSGTEGIQISDAEGFRCVIMPIRI